METKNVDDRLLNIKEASKYLGISSVTLLRKIKAEEVGYFRIGKRVLFSMPAHLLPFLQRCEQKAKED